MNVTKTITLVCLHPCLCSDKTKGMVFRELIDGNLLDEDIVFSAKGPGQGCLPGGMYTFEYKTREPLQIFTKVRQWQGRWGNQDDLTKWTAMARSFDVAEAAKKAQANEKKRDVIEECLAPLRQVYLKLPAPQQRALETVVLMALRKKMK